MVVASLLENQLLLLFIILFLGSVFGKMSIKGLSLGSSGVLLVGMVFGHFGYQVSNHVQQLGLSLFIVAVGLSAGPRFFRMMRTNGIIFGIIGILIVLVAGVVTVIVAKLFGFAPGLTIGLMTGALTSTPGLASALQATDDPLASVGYGIAYPFGVLAVVLFIQLIPRFLKVDLNKEVTEGRSLLRNEESPEVMTIEVTNTKYNKRTIKELHFERYHTIVISRVIRKDRTIIALNDTVILKGDYLVAVGLKKDLDELCQDLGKRAQIELSNTDHIKLRKVTVESDEVIGKNLRELQLRSRYGVTVTRFARGGFEYNQNPKMRLERGDILTIVSSEARLNEVEKLFSKKQHTVTNVHILSLSFILLIGIMLGMVDIPIPGVGSINLGVAGGPLFIALIIGHFGKLGPIQARYYQPSTKVISDLGLVLFLAGAGTTAGQGIIDVVKEEGLGLVFGGSIITLTPIIVGFFLSKFVFKLNMVQSLGVLSGGMTSTPGLGAVNQLTTSNEPAIAYAAAYPFALIAVSILAQVLIFFL